jgi:hypothetical protein
MENLYIEVVDGNIINHPIFESNLIQAFPEIDLANQDKYVPFQRVPQPQIGIFEVNEGVSYEFVSSNLVKDVWNVRPMTDEEKQAKIAAARSQQPYPSWTLDEATLLWWPPVPYPQSQDPNIKIFYRWNEDILNWEEEARKPN